MNAKEVKDVLIKAKAVIEIVDKWDDTAISVLKSIASLSFAPLWLKTAAFLIEQYEKKIIEKGKTAIDFVLSLFGGMEKSEKHGEEKTFESKEQKSEEKLQITLAEVKPLLIPVLPVKEKEEKQEEDKGVLDTIQGVTEKVSGVIGLINSFKEMF